jgi:hypothetical protein
MIVYDKLYRAIKTHLNDVLKIKRVDWFNNQYENFEDNKAIPRRAVECHVIWYKRSRTSRRNALGRTERVNRRGQPGRCILY